MSSWGSTINQLRQFCIHGHDTFVTGKNRHGACRVCVRRNALKYCLANKDRARAYYLATRTKALQDSKKRYEQNPQPTIDRAILWNKTNKAKRFAIYRRWYAKHQAQIIEKYRAWRRNNPSASRERTNRYRRLHPELTRAIAQIWGNRRRAWKMSITATLTKQEWLSVLTNHGGRCVRCKTENDISMDHIIPLSRGGDHTKENVQPLCRPCNSRKKNRLESELITTPPTRELK